MSRLKAILIAEAERTSETLKNMDAGTDEYTAAVDNVNAVVDHVIEMEKIENERKKIENEKILKMVGIGVTVITFVGGLIFKGWAHKDNKRYEGYCTSTTTAGRIAEKELFDVDAVKL